MADAAVRVFCLERHPGSRQRWVGPWCVDQENHGPCHRMWNILLPYLILDPRVYQKLVAYYKSYYLLFIYLSFTVYILQREYCMNQPGMASHVFFWGSWSTAVRSLLVFALVCFGRLLSRKRGRFPVSRIHQPAHILHRTHTQLTWRLGGLFQRHATTDLDTKHQCFCSITSAWNPRTT